MATKVRSKWLGIALGSAGLLALGLSFPAAAHAGKALARLSAVQTGVDGNAILLPSSNPAYDSPAPPNTPGGIEIYNNTLKMPGDNVAYLTISATGIVDDNCDAIALNCQIDGVPCLQGNGLQGGGSVAHIPAGWVIPLGDEYGCSGELGATGVQFQFCAPLSKTKGNMHTLSLYAASAFGSGDAYLEAVHVFVDANKIKGKNNFNACGTYPSPNPGDSFD